MSILSLLFPEKCPFCGKIIAQKQYETAGACPQCQTGMYFRPVHGDCVPEVLSDVSNLYCPLLYSGTAKQAILRYKFQGENWMAAPFATILHTYISACGGYADCNYITAAPLSGPGMRRRGYNQAAAIACALSQKTGIPYIRLLTRDDAKDQQTGKMNRKGRFATDRFRLIQDRPHLDHCGILFVDDILTTGSTVHECTSLLRDAGAGLMKVAVLASGRRDLGGLSA